MSRLANYWKSQTPSDQHHRCFQTNTESLSSLEIIRLLDLQEKMKKYQLTSKHIDCDVPVADTGPTLCVATHWPWLILWSCWNHTSSGIVGT
jgi:hypothetical protein